MPPRLLHDHPMPFDVNAVSLAELRNRQSAKYRAYPPDVIPAWVAEMDFPLAEPIARALHAAIDRSDTGYQSGAGLAEACTEFAARTWSWQVNAANVVGVADVLTGIHWALRLLTPPGAGVVITPPVYPPFYSTVTEIAERNLVEVPLHGDVAAGYSLDLEALERAFARPDVSAFVLCSPHNPTGTVPTRAELERVAELAAAFNVLVVADEIHAPLTLAGAVHTPYLTVAGADARAVSVVSASKTWNLPGLKCAQVVSTERTRSEFTDRLPMEVRYGLGHLGAIASIAAYREGEPWREHVLAIINTNRELLDELLTHHAPRARYRPPQASYLAWIDLNDYAIGPDPAALLLERARVAVNAGPTFGIGGAGHVRLNMGTSPALLTEVVTRIGGALEDQPRGQ